MKKDYYEILGVARDAAAQDIKKKYRSLALKHHPDRVPAEQKKEAEEKFKEISEAYGVLSDPQKRQLYDQHGHQGIDQRYTAEDIFGNADFSSVFGESGLGDIFSHFFGGGFETSGSRGGRGQQASRGHDIQYEVEITLTEAFHGVKKKLQVPRYEYCISCKGTGAQNGTALKNCPTCKGAGQVVMASGFFRMAQTCPDCRGQGRTITEKCSHCSGKGAVKVTRNIDVTIPAGVDNDSRLRIRGEGEVGSGGAGDLYLYIRVMEHPEFHRNGNDIHLDLPVSFVKAALGSDVHVPTINGDVSMKVPAGTQSGKVFRLREKGMPDLRSGGRGDQYVRVMIEVPQHLSAEQRRLLEEYAKLSGEEVGIRESSIKDKIKKVFK